MICASSRPGDFPAACCAHPLDSAPHPPASRVGGRLPRGWLPRAAPGASCSARGRAPADARHRLVLQGRRGAGAHRLALGCVPARSARACGCAWMPQYDEVDLEDMDYDTEARVYTYQCPCGDLFHIALVRARCARCARACARRAALHASRCPVVRCAALRRAAPRALRRAACAPCVRPPAAAAA